MHAYRLLWWKFDFRRLDHGHVLEGALHRRVYRYVRCRSISRVCAWYHISVHVEVLAVLLNLHITVVHYSYSVMFVLRVIVYFPVAFSGALFDPVLRNNCWSPARFRHYGANIPEGPINTQAARAVRRINLSVECLHRLNEQQVKQRPKTDVVRVRRRGRRVRCNNTMQVPVIICRTRHLVGGWPTFSGRFGYWSCRGLGAFPPESDSRPGHRGTSSYS